MYEFDDFYGEPSEFDISVAELKVNLKKSVKQEFLDEMERLRKENAELKEIKEFKQKYEQELRDAKESYQRKERNLEYEIKRKKYEEIFTDFLKDGFCVGFDYEYIHPKCDKCNDSRIIEFTSPLGNKLTERCDCAETKSIYVPTPCSILRFEIGSSNKVWFKYQRKGYGSDSVWHDFTAKRLPSVDDYNSCDKYDYIFETEEECQKFCNWLTDKER